MTMAWCANCHAWDLDAYKAMWQAAPVVEQEPVGEVVYIPVGERDRKDALVAVLSKRLEEGAKLYTQPQLNPITWHEVETAMMECEINHCENPDVYTLDILKRLGIGVK